MNTTKTTTTSLWQEGDWYRFFMKELNDKMVKSHETLTYIPFPKTREETSKQAFDSLVDDILIDTDDFTSEIKKNLVSYTQKKETQSFIRMIVTIFLTVTFAACLIYINYEKIGIRLIGLILGSVVFVCLIIYAHKGLIQKGMRDAIIRRCGE